MAKEICLINTFGYCKHGDLCRYLHVNDLCESTSCDLRNCNKRQFCTCKFNDYCKCKHTNYENNLEIETNRKLII